MTTDELRVQLETRAEAELASGGSIEIDRRAGYVAIKLSDGSEYFFQDNEAYTLIDSCPDWVSEEAFILASAQDW